MNLQRQRAVFILFFFYLGLILVLLQKLPAPNGEFVSVQRCSPSVSWDLFVLQLCQNHTWGWFSVALFFIFIFCFILSNHRQHLICGIVCEQKTESLKLMNQPIQRGGAFIKWFCYLEIMLNNYFKRINCSLKLGSLKFEVNVRMVVPDVQPCVQDIRGSWMSWGAVRAQVSLGTSHPQVRWHIILFHNPPLSVFFYYYF